MRIDELKSEISAIDGGDDFLKEYLIAVGFTASDEDGDSPFDVGPGEVTDYIDDSDVWDVLNDAERIELLTDVLGFLRDSADIVPVDMIEQAARDFHFTRNGHGCGFGGSFEGG